MNNYVYEFEGKLYLNITNRCPNDCEFCVRNFKDGISDNELWLSKEPEENELKAALDEHNVGAYKEVVFCGFGEPVCNMDMILKIAPYIKSFGVKTRLNTNGLANLINDCDNAAELLAPCIDYVSISLNASTAEKYQKICRSCYGEEAFYEMLRFAKQAVEAGIDVTMSVVDVIGEREIEACAKLAAEAGAHYRVRKMITADK